VKQRKAQDPNGTDLRPLDLPFDQRLATKAQEDANVSTIRRLTNPTSEPNSSDREEGRADGSEVSAAGGGGQE